jgi:hypothetical protein
MINSNYGGDTWREGVVVCPFHYFPKLFSDTGLFSDFTADVYAVLQHVWRAGDVIFLKSEHRLKKFDHWKSQRVVHAVFTP